MRSFRRGILFLLFTFALAAMAEAAAPNGVKYTAHNLGTTNVGGNFQADPSVPGNETEICVFCHTPHNAAAGKKFLWNRPDSTATFALYTASPTLNFNRGIQISDISKMCMSCHDGGTALNSMANPRNVAMQGGITGDEIGDIWDNTLLGTGWGPNIGEGSGVDNVTPGGNLTNDHPISFLYSQSSAGDNSIKAATGGSVGDLPLWDGKVECVTCHDPHINYNVNFPTLDGNRAAYKPFLRKSNSSSNLCFTCHEK